MYQVKTFYDDTAIWKLINYLNHNFIPKECIISVHYGVNVNGKQYIQVIYTSE